MTVFWASFLLLCFFVFIGEDLSQEHQLNQKSINYPISKLAKLILPLFQCWHSAVSVAAVCRTREAVAARSLALSERMCFHDIRYFSGQKEKWYHIHHTHAYYFSKVYYFGINVIRWEINYNTINIEFNVFWILNH